MSCYHPMVYVQTADMTDPHVRAIVENLKIKHHCADKKKWISGNLIPRELLVREGIKLESTNALLVPCGRCIGCRLDYSRQWAERCIHEASMYEHNYFLTLTYDDDHLPINPKTKFATLIKDEISSFMKRLRESLRSKLGIDGVRFFACGEYGEGNGVGDNVYTMFRPHYHIILFNCPLPDLSERHPIPVDGKIKMIKQYASDGSQLYFSQIVFDAWQHRGTAQLGQVSYESCAYVARYVVKKLYGKDAKKYEDAGVVAPFVRMSRDPGIGYEWYMTNLEHIYEFDNLNIKRGEKVITMKPGRYCDKLLKEVDQDRFYKLKMKRHNDFYDSVDCKTYEAVDLVINNRRAETQKIRSAKILKRSI